MKANKKSWTVKFETTSDVVRTVRWYAATVAEAVTLTCEEYSVANILAEAFPAAEVNDLYKKYVDAYAQGQNIVNLNLVQNLANP